MNPTNPVSGPRRLLRRIRDVMAGGGSAQHRLDQVVKLIAGDMVAEVCSCYLMRAGEVLELFATQGLNPESVHSTRLRVGEGLVGHIAAYGRPLNLADAQSHPLYAYRPETGEEIYQSLMGVPITRDGRVVGVLVVQNRTRRHYDEEEVEALLIIAMVLAELVAGGDLVNPQELIESQGAIPGTEVLDGLPLVAGVGLGVIVAHSPQVVVHDLVADDPNHERERLANAVESLQSDVDRLLDAPDLAQAGVHRDILETYRMFSRDSGWLRRIDEAIGSGLVADAAVVRVRDDMRLRLSQATDHYIRERIADLDDLANRLLKYLSGAEDVPRANQFDAPFILVARSLGPAEFFDYDRDLMRGVVLEEGSPATHVTIIARAFEVPLIGRVRDALARLRSGETAIVDGERGQIVTRPSGNLIQAVQEFDTNRAAQRVAYQALRDEPARTRDGVDITMSINAGLLVDLDRLHESGADGVGLFRTEIPFMISAEFPDVDAQSDLYANIFRQAADKPVVFRTLDIGADKRLPYLPLDEEENPALGWRSIRIGLDQPAILRQQLRALIQAAAGRPLSIMFPMVSQVAEFESARHLVDRELARAQELGHPLPERVRAGVMLEVPALIWELDRLWPLVDFISVGTNDLMQFLFASDRSNPKVADRYSLLTQSGLSLMADITARAADAEVELSVCGEAAGRPLEAMALIGCGVRHLSMAPSRLGGIKMMIRSLSYEPLRKYVTSLRAGATTNLRQSLRGYARDHNIVI